MKEKRLVFADTIARKAVNSLLKTLDTEFENTTKKSTGPMGDKLAYQIHELVEKSIIEFGLYPECPLLVNESFYGGFIETWEKKHNLN